jgi:2'-5' RNA ligase
VRSSGTVRDTGHGGVAQDVPAGRRGAAARDGRRYGQLSRADSPTAAMESLDNPAPAAAPTQSAIIVPVPAAEAVVARHRRFLDRSAAWGVPAHVTVLYPFVPPAALDNGTVAAAAAAVASVAAFDCTFVATRWFGSDVLWLEPRPAEPLRRLTRAVWAAFPGYPPYEGVHDGIEPHLTVGERALGGPGALEAAEAAVLPALPFSQHVDHAVLVVGSGQPRSWRIQARLPLAND